MAYTLQDLEGKHHTVETEVKMIQEENGPVYIEFTVSPTANNKKFIRDITEDWLFYGVKDEIYGHFVINYLEKEGVGKYPELKVKAIAQVIHKLQTTTLEGYYTGSRTFSDYFSIISQQTGISIYPMTDRNAFGWDKFGLGAQAIEEFTRGINNYDVTYKITAPNIIELHDKIGRSPQYVIKNAMNADSFNLQIDYSTPYTYIEGYGDFDSEDANFYAKANLYSFYKSPKYDLIGEKRAPVYKNSKIKDKAVLDRHLKEIVDGAVKIALKTKFRELDNYPYGAPLIGDNITVQDETIDLNAEARIVKLMTYFDAYGDIYDYDVEFGNVSLGQRKRITAASVSRQLSDIKEGRTPLSLSAFSDYTAAAILDMKAAQTEVTIGTTENGLNGITLLEKTDKNRGIWLNSRGILISRDGFQTAEVSINADGINATTIRTGTMMADRIMGGVLKDFYGNFEWNLGTGKFYIGSSSLVYKQAGNALVYGALGNAAGITFSSEVGTGYPVMVLGTSPNIGTEQDPILDVNNVKLAGVRTFNGGISGNRTEIIADTILFRNVSGTHDGYSLSLSFSNGVTALEKASDHEFRIGAETRAIQGVFTQKLNSMMATKNGIMSSDGQNGVVFDANGSDFALVYKGKAYLVSDILQNKAFTV